MSLPEPEMPIEGKVAAAAPAPNDGLGRRAFGGVLWSLGQTLGSKTATFAQQILLAKLLDIEDFGLVAMLWILSFVSLGQQLGIGEILVRRHRRFDKWAEIAFWMNLTGALVGFLAVLILAPFTGALLHRPELGNLLIVGALALPMDAMTAVPQARMRINMRFRALALLGTWNVFGMAILSVCFALLGWGAYSLVLPRPILSAVNLLASLKLEPIRLHFRPNLRRWPFVLRDSRYFIVTNVFGVFLTQGDYMLTGAFFSKDILGAYYWAFNNSTQTNQLVGSNLASVLLPSFAKLDNDERRQAAAYQSACAAIALVGVPLCFLQALIAPPAFALLFGHKMDSALPLFQLLSIGMAFVVPGGASVSLLQAQGRYRLTMYWMIISSVSFVAFVLCGALFNNIVIVATVVAIYYAIFGPLGVMLPTFRTRDLVMPFLARVYAFPMLAGGAAAAVSWRVSGIWSGGNLWLATIRVTVWLACYALLLMLIRPPEAIGLSQRLRVVLFKRRSPA